MTGLHPELVADLGAELLEAPVWDADQASLLCVDILAGVVHRWCPGSGARTVLRLDRPIGAALPRAGGGLVLAARGGIAVADDDGGPSRLLVPIDEDRPRNMMNDAKCDPWGRLWAGTIDEDERVGAGRLHRIDPDGTSRAVIEGVTISNGLGWSPDGSRMFYVDSPTCRIDQFDYDGATGEISGRRVFAEPVGGGGAVPDGLAVDAEGAVWVALWGGSRVERYVDGRLDESIELPVSHVTSCAFGGPTLDELFVTTAALDAEHERSRGAGGLFRCRPGVRGTAVSPFGVDE